MDIFKDSNSRTLISGDCVHIFGQECGDTDYCCAGEQTTTTTKPDISCKFLENTLLNGQSLFPDGVLITGNGGSPGDTAELYVPSSGLSCSLPLLPGGGWYYTHTVESSGLNCAGRESKDICVQWNPDTGSWKELLHLDIGRYSHVSWTPDNGIGTYLIGGYYTDRTTTLIQSDGTQEAAFPLQYDTR